MTNPSGSRRAAAAAAALALVSAALLVPAPAAAQASGMSVVPKIGVVTPLGSLTEDAEMRVALTVGLALHLALPDLPFGVRANVDHIRSADIRQRGADDLKQGTADITQIVGDVVFRPVTGLTAAAPYLLVGAGVRMYEIDVEPGSDLALLRSSFSRFTGHLGGGIDVRIGPATVVAEVADYISTFVLPDGGSKLQNDVVAMIGIRIGLF